MESTAQGVYAQPRSVSDVGDCHFYHTMDLPGHGLVEGEWDLRGGVDAYLGFVPLKGKRILEVGTASGYLCFEMEKRGAEVVACDLSDTDDWDVVPYGGVVTEDYLRERRNTIRGINNAWWLAHRLLKSQARVVYSSVYQIPKEIGAVDVATFGCILLHLRDPFLALQKAAALTKECIIVTDLLSPIPRKVFSLASLLPRTIRRYTVDQILYSPHFLPDPDRRTPWDGWWGLTPELVERFLKVLGFSDTTITFHRQRLTKHARPARLFTVVGRRQNDLRR
ncbi:MAG: hypothetical protein ABSB75_00225 [Candidatus Limnocylindrales bacterium]